METIFISVLFSIPGFIANMLEDRLFNKITIEKTNFDKTIPAIIYSSLILILNVTVMKNIFKVKINTFYELIQKLSNLEFFNKYLLLSFATCFIFVFVKVYIWDKLVLFFINIWRKLRNLPSETKFNTVWEEVFENPENPIMDKIISIEKDGVVISKGVLEKFNSHNGKNREFLLIETEETKEFLEDPENLLDKIDMEYYDQDSGHLIKFYNTEKLYKYLSE